MLRQSEGIGAFWPYSDCDPPGEGKEPLEEPLENEETTEEQVSGIMALTFPMQ